MSHIATLQRNNKGMTLIEVLVSFVILGFLASSVGLWFLYNHNTLVRAEAKNQASYTAQRIVDSLQARGLNAVDTNTQIFSCGNQSTRAMTCTTSVRAQDTISGEIVSKKIHVGIHWKVGATDQNHSVEGVLQ